jgi:GNAT superfamily N-acetyltransferase
LVIREVDASLSRNRAQLIRFITLYGDKRITRQAVNWLNEAREETLASEGNLILAAVDQSRLCGIAAVADYGRSESFIAVHRNRRRSGCGQQLIEAVLTRLGKVYGRVALDNLPSLKMCLASGMVGFKCFTGPTGKPTLWLGAGNWRIEDIE